MGLGRYHLKVGQQSETTLLHIVIRDPSNISSSFRAFPSQVQPVSLMGTLADLCLCLLGLSSPGGHLQGDLGDLLMEIQLARDLGLSC